MVLLPSGSDRCLALGVVALQLRPPLPPLLTSFLNSDIIDLKMSSMAVRAALACSVTGGQILGFVFLSFSTSALLCTISVIVVTLLAVYPAPELVA